MAGGGRERGGGGRDVSGRHTVVMVIGTGEAQEDLKRPRLCTWFLRTVPVGGFPVLFPGRGHAETSAGGSPGSCLASKKPLSGQRRPDAGAQASIRAGHPRAHPSPELGCAASA